MAVIMKASSPPCATPSILSNPLNTPNERGIHDYFATSQVVEGAVQSIELQQLGGVEKDELSIQNTSAPAITDILPNELFCLILELGYFESNGVFPDTHFRSSMLQISRTFRQLTLSTPSLWSIIHLNPGNVEQELEKLPLYLERSAQYPLEIQLSCFWDTDIAESVLGRLIPHSRRWRKLSFVTMNSYSLSLLENVSVPILEDLEISFFSHNQRIALPSAFLSAETPSLVHLCLRNVDLDTLQFPLQNLKTLEIRGYGRWPNIQRVREMLECATSLEKLILHVKPGQAIQEMRIEEGRGKSQILLAAVRTLEVYTSEWLSSKVVTLVRTFACPKLESFVLREGVGSATQTSRTIMSYNFAPYRHKDTSLYNHLGEELCTGHPSRMFVQMASMSAACETLSLSSLTSLELRKPILPSFSTMRSTFSELENLKHLYFLDMNPTDPSIIETISDQDTLLPRISEIVVPSLETFVLEVSQSQHSNFSSDFTAEFISVFHLPALRSLTLKNVKLYPLKKLVSSFSIRTEVYTQLTSLQLIDIKDVIPADPTAELAFAFPRLRRLALDSVSSNSFIHQLRPMLSGPRAGTLPWPDMDELSVCNDCNVSKPLLHRVVSEREKMGKPLLKLDLDDHFSNQDSRDWLNEHVNVGLARPGFL